MSKKEYILKLFESLGKNWEAAKGLKILIERNLLDDTTVDALIQIIKSKVQETSNAIQKEKLDKSVAFLEKLKESESKEYEKDEEYLEQLDNILEEV